ncbi:uncharacterized protein WM277_021570 isoform 2-T2 [Molossus nigricans]
MRRGKHKCSPPLPQIMQSSFPHLGKSQGSAFQSAMDTPSPGKTTFLIMWASPLGLRGSRRCPAGTAPCQPWWTRPAWQWPNGPAHLGALSPWSAGAFLQFAAKSALQFFTLVIAAENETVGLAMEPWGFQD